MQEVQLTQRKRHEAEQDQPRGRAVELVLAVHDRAHQQLDRALGHEQQQRRQDAADAAVRHALQQAQPRGMVRRGAAAGEEGQSARAEQDARDQQRLEGHPAEELRARQQREELVERVRGLADGAEGGDQHGAGEDEEGARERVAREGLAEDERGADGVEDEAGLEPPVSDVWSGVRLESLQRSRADLTA